MKIFRRKFLPVVGIAVVIAGGVVYIFVMTPVFQVVTGSMEPTLPIGSVIFEVPAKVLKPGDIITFQQADNKLPITHTFIGYNDDGSLITKGDANPNPDERAVPLAKDDVLGKVVLMSPFLVSSFWLSQRGVFVVVLVISGIFMLCLSFKLNKRKVVVVQANEPHEPNVLHESHGERRQLSPV